MGLFFKKKVPVRVMRKNPVDIGDGRYKKQEKLNRKVERLKEKYVVFEPHTPAELRGYIESKYQVQELPKTDERYRKGYMNVKSHLVFEYAPKMVSTKALSKPGHAPRSSEDPDYKAYYENKDQRFRESIMISNEDFPMHFHMYSIYISVNEYPVAWLEVYVETVHEFLAFNVVKLEEEQHYSIDQVKKDIIRYFGVSEEDQKEYNERYLQYLNIL